jgi:DNA-binding transcriptional regulator YhcF (GntR family)
MAKYCEDCYAGAKWFAKQFNVTDVTIRRWRMQLAKHGYIKVVKNPEEYKRRLKPQSVQSDDYIIIPDHIATDSSISYFARVLWGELWFLSRLKGYAWPKNEELAEQYNVSVRLVGMAINELEEAKYIERVYETGENKPRNGVYRKIYVNEEPEVNESVPANSVSPDGKMCILDGGRICTRNKNSYLVLISSKPRKITNLEQRKININTKTRKNSRSRAREPADDPY